MIDANFTVVDSGLFTELAVRLARETTGKVRSHVPWRAEFPTMNDRAVGAGLAEVEWVEDPYRREIFDDTDIYVFPDIFFAGEQQLLKRLGKLVWGSNTGDELETKRVWFRRLQEELGMPVPKYEVVTGWKSLIDYLQQNDRHCFIKATSKIRGSMETQEFFDYEQGEYWLWNLRCQLGGAAESVMFLVEDPVDTPFETGIDTYCVLGKFPKTPMQGIEVKGKLILSSAQTKSPTPRALDDALSVLAPILRDNEYCNFLSAEFRGNILTDFCARAPNPGVGVEMEMIRNLGEIINAGVRGEIIEPDYEAEFGIQAAIFHDHPEELWKKFRIAPELRRWIKLMEFCKVQDLYNIIPRPPHGQKIGWVIGIGNSIQEAADHIQANIKALKNYPFDIKIDELEDAVFQAHEMEKRGMEFSDEPLPAPDEVVHDAHD